MRNPTKSERKLAEIAIELAIFSGKYMQGKSIEEIAVWAVGQLQECGFENKPVGSCWAYLTKIKESKLERF